jgi:hypothetical protein
MRILHVRLSIKYLKCISAKAEHSRFDILKVRAMKITVFGDLVPCSRADSLQTIQNYPKDAGNKVL